MARSQFPLSGYFICALIAANLDLIVGSNAAWDTSSARVKVGENIELTCTITDVGKYDVVTVMKSNEDGEQLVKIADKSTLAQTFADTGRYSVNYDYDRATRTGVLILKYEGIQGEDQGEISCFERTGNDLPPARATVNLNVEVPVSELFIMVRDEEGNTVPVEGLDVDLVEGQDDLVACKATVNGSLVPPEMRIEIGGEDETEIFHSKPHFESINPDGGLGTWYSEKILEYTTSKPDPRFNTKMMTCYAEMEGYPERSVSATLNIQYAPKVTCSKYKHFGPVGGSMEMTCEVRSNPLGSIEWQFGNGDDLRKATEDANITESITDVNADLSKATLHIKSINSEHFGDYFLIAKNPIDERRVVLTLTQSADPNKEEIMPNEQPNSPDGSDASAGAVRGSGVSLVSCWQLYVFLASLLILRRSL